MIDEIRLSIKSIGHEGENNHWQSVCNLLNRFANVDCRNVTRTNCQQVGSIRVCDYDSIIMTFDRPVPWSRIELIHRELTALAGSGVSLGFRNGQFGAEYVGLMAEGDVSVSVRISVTPGAILYLERRWEGICEKVPTENNLYEGEISLRMGQEWVFYRTEVNSESDPVERFFRLNIVTRATEELNRESFYRLIARR